MRRQCLDPSVTLITLSQRTAEANHPFGLWLVERGIARMHSSGTIKRHRKSVRARRARLEVSNNAHRIAITISREVRLGSPKFVAGQEPAICFSGRALAYSAGYGNPGCLLGLPVDLVDPDVAKEGTVIDVSPGLPASARDVDGIARRCRGIVRTRAVASATVALVPIPGLDLVADVALLARMIERINCEFGLRGCEKIPRPDDVCGIMYSGLGARQRR